jgi:hypothetical protein
MRKRGCPASGAGRGHGDHRIQRSSVGFPTGGRPTILSHPHHQFLLFISGRVVVRGPRWGVVRVTRVSPRGGYRATTHETCRGPLDPVVPMRGEMIENKNVGPRGSLLQAPAGGLGADFKTTPSWGGSARDPPGPSAYAARWLK